MGGVREREKQGTSPDKLGYEQYQEHLRNSPIDSRTISDRRALGHSFRAAKTLVSEQAAPMARLMGLEPEYGYKSMDKITLPSKAARELISNFGVGPNHIPGLRLDVVDGRAVAEVKPVLAWLALIAPLDKHYSTALRPGLARKSGKHGEALLEWFGVGKFYPLEKQYDFIEKTEMYDVQTQRVYRAIQAFAEDESHTLASAGLSQQDRRILEAVGQQLTKSTTAMQQFRESIAPELYTGATIKAKDEDEKEDLF